MKEHYCSICDKSTYDVDYEYLIGFDHLACHLGVWGGEKLFEKAMKKKKSMKIKGWEKISGFTYKGYCIVNPIHNAEETKYIADVLNFNLPHKPKWELNVLSPGHKWKVVNDDMFHIMLWDEDKFSARRELNKDMISTISNFRKTFEDLVDELLHLRLTTAPSSHSFQTNGPAVVTGTGGIINTVNGSGSNFTLNTGQFGVSILDSIKELQKQIDDLKSKTN
jgi:hypothetical protein